MTQPPLPSSRRELRKALVRLRLEMHRQEIRHEAQVITRPLRRVKGLAQGFRIPWARGTHHSGALPASPRWASSPPAAARWRAGSGWVAPCCRCWVPSGSNAAR